VATKLEMATTIPMMIAGVPTATIPTTIPTTSNTETVIIMGTNNPMIIKTKDIVRIDTMIEDEKELRYVQYVIL
jgi:hypothetical protein